MLVQALMTVPWFLFPWAAAIICMELLVFHLQAHIERWRARTIGPRRDGLMMSQTGTLVSFETISMISWIDFI